MKQRYLEVTFRKGKLFAAYLYLPQPSGIKSARTEDAGHGLLIDFDASGRPIGIEIATPSALTAAELSALLDALGLEQLGPDELAVLAA